MRAQYLRNLAAILGFGALTAYSGMFLLDPYNPWISIYLKLVSLGLFPITICFSWLYLWRDSENPFRFLALYNCGTQSLFLAMNLLRVSVSKLGFFGLLYAVMSLTLIVIYLTDWSYGRLGFFFTGGFILLNVVFAFALVMTTFEHVHPFFAMGSTGMNALGSFVAEMSVMGALLTASSQLYWHEILKKRRDEMIIEQLFAALDS